jgi:predicted NAD-dependent protein-ADP-ribosyltransferase YbiA (DUF1768 family)
MNMKNLIQFNSESKNAQCLSNFAEISVKVNDQYYKTGEHAFHGTKYRCAAKCTKSKERKKELLEYAKKFEWNGKFNTPLEAKKAGGKKGLFLENYELEQWSDESIDVQKEICAYKYLHNEEVKETIDENENKYLLHQDNRAKTNTLWGGKFDKKTDNIIGHNRLGLIWMNIISNFN